MKDMAWVIKRNNAHAYYDLLKTKKKHMHFQYL